MSNSAYFVHLSLLKYIATTGHQSHLTEQMPWLLAAYAVMILEDAPKSKLFKTIYGPWALEWKNVCRTQNTCNFTEALGSWHSTLICFKLGLQGTPAKIAARQPTWIHTLSRNCGVAVAKSNLEGWSLSLLPAQKLEKLEERGEKTIWAKRLALLANLCHLVETDGKMGWFGLLGSGAVENGHRQPIEWSVAGPHLVRRSMN